jgi:hypothetical protein
LLLFYPLIFAAVIQSLAQFTQSCPQKRDKCELKK